MAGYIHGATKKTPVAILNTFEARINQAKEILAATEQSVQGKLEEDRRLRDELRVRRMQVGVLRHYHLPHRKFDPKAFRKEAQYAYDVAMRRHPDNATEGKERMALILAEMQHVKLRTQNRRMAAPLAHQEAA